MRALFIALATLAAGCGLGGPPPGMTAVEPRAVASDSSLVELARTPTNDAERVLLAVYPRDACTGFSSAVLTDSKGRFVGAVAPGTASLLRVPRDAPYLLAFSSIDVTGGEWGEPLVQQVELPPFPSGLLFRTMRASFRRCGRGQYMEAIAASKGELEDAIAESEAAFFEADVEKGQRWLDDHAGRVARILGLAPAPPSGLSRRARVVFR
jgi:hypothetical protein